MSVIVLQLQKRSSYEFRHIQDKYSINSETQTFALSDGTTQSFNSEHWAELITSSFVDSPKFHPDDAIAFFTECVGVYKSLPFEFSPNPAKASLEKAKMAKGSTATFIGVQIHNETELKVISCGDSNLFIWEKEKNVTSFPFVDVDTLDANNHFINTEQLIEKNIDDTFFKQASIRCKPTDVAILASDALSRLILKHPETIIDLMGIRTFDQFHDFCISKWESKDLQEDDISAIIIPLAKTSEVELIIPPSEFSFPKEQEGEFIPASLTQNNLENLTEMEINEIRIRLNALANDNNVVKSKLKLHEMLLIGFIGLMLVSLCYIVFFNNEEQTGNTRREIYFEQKLNEQLKTNRSQKREIENLKKQLGGKVTNSTNDQIEKSNKKDTVEAGSKNTENAKLKKGD